MSHRAPGRGGLVLVDKPGGLTSHDVVARIRRCAGTRRVGHAGTLDPMATGLLVVAVERATRILGYLSGAAKGYAATIRLGASTDTDDATGRVLTSAPAGGLRAEAVRAAMAGLTGSILQVPATVSAVKVGGRRAYRLARSGEPVSLPARPVTVHGFELLTVHADPAREWLDLDVTVRCSSGTYVRALARDLGRALEVGGHLTRLRRTRVGAYGLEQARTLEQLEERFAFLSLDAAAAAAFPRYDVDAEGARIVGHGGWIPATGACGQGPFGIFGPDGTLVAMAEQRDGRAVPRAVFTA